MVVSHKFLGQWLGVISGTNNGIAVVNVDHDRPNQGSVQVYDSRQPFLAQATFEISGQNIKANLDRFIPQGGFVQQGVRLPQTGTLSGTLQGERLTGTWKSDIGTNGAFDLTYRDTLTSREADWTMSWQDFRNWVVEETRKLPSLIFRGHDSSQHPLVTTFHRTGRRNLLRYGTEDVPRLCRLIEASLNTKYDLNDPFDYGNLLNLAQHHGYPTPLLDWTESPFVAAFFAFSALKKTMPPNDKNVRIYLFDPDGWPYKELQNIGEARPSFTRLELRSRNNPRVIPQQSIHMFSNLVDIEGFIANTEKELNRQFLRRVDIPAIERSLTMRELDTMGVTAASLFPGVDGLCRSLAEKYF